MPSIHVWKSIKVAEEKGGFASDRESLPLWGMSKRELVEVVIRLGCMVSGECDDPVAGIKEALKEHSTLERNGII